MNKPNEVHEKTNENIVKKQRMDKREKLFSG